MISRKIITLSCILPFLAFSSCNNSQPIKSNFGTCEPLRGWNDAQSFRIPDEAQFNSIYVDNHRILLNGTAINKVELEFYIDELKKMKNESKYVEFYIFLHSDGKYACSDFKKIAQKIDSGQKCAQDGTCIWAYGLGINAKPRGHIVM